MKKAVAFLTILFVAISIALLSVATAAPVVVITAAEDVETTPNSDITLTVTAKNSGGSSGDTQIVVERASLPEGFTVTKESGTERIVQTRSETFTIRLRVGDVSPGVYTLRLYDLTAGDTRSFEEVNITVTAETTPTPMPTATRTATVTGTETPTVTATATETGTEEPTETTSPGFGAATLLFSGGAALMLKRMR